MRATLKDISYNHMDVSGIGEVIVQEEMGYHLKIHVLVSTGLGEGKLVVGFEDLKNFIFYTKNFPEPYLNSEEGQS